MHPSFNLLTLLLISFIGWQVKLHVHPRASFLTNCYHLLHKAVGSLDTPIHLIEETDFDSLKKIRWLYGLMTMFEKRYDTSSQLFTVPSRIGNHKIPITLYKAKEQVNKDGILPVVMYFHGGGYTLGHTEMYEHITTAIASESQVAVAFVDYRLGKYNNSFPFACSVVFRHTIPVHTS